ncbi:lactosylceramide 4-alpha-galactosyltransferase-like [Penaeus japonicus]|uniref:lactosylceramide 4-alpha-galactosyltransferase-like n=1 Tax=Penaeus japonicus TaxID=27405 RepID=UPI001C70CD37|nr:lactosylceramide 4-alpha-galactosyltransferase-like [Penaeus japonicus]
MIIGPRPTLGWVGYLMLGGSWYRLATVIGLFGFATIFLVHQGRQAITLHYTMPVPFPPPVMFLPSPAHAHTTALDACSVEAAGVNPFNPTDRRKVYVFMWGMTLSPRDVWGRWILGLPKVDMSLVNLPKIVNRTPLESLKGHTTWSGWPDWVVWAATRVSLLWAAGGMVLPLGAIMTKPLMVDAHGPKSGLVAEAEGGGVDALLMAAPAHHPVLLALADQLMNSSIEGNQGSLLTKVFREVCSVDNIRDMPFSDCPQFAVLKGRAVVDFGDADVPQPTGGGTEGFLIRYIGDLHHLQDLRRTHQLFENNNLHHYCPLTAKYVETLWRDSF